MISMLRKRQKVSDHGRRHANENSDDRRENDGDSKLIQPVQLSILFLRTDWLKELGLPEPKTMDDFIEIAEAFKAKNPGGTKQAYGIAVSKNPFSTETGVTGLRAFLNGYHAYENIWMEDGNGGLMNSDIQPEMKQALAALQDMFKKG